MKKRGRQKSTAPESTQKVKRRTKKNQPVTDHVNEQSPLSISEIDRTYKKDPKIIEKTKKLIRYRMPLIHYVKEFPSSTAETDQQERTTLHWAVMQGKLNIVNILFTHGNPPMEAEDLYKCTPLHYAIETSHETTLGIIQSLLDKGANLFAQDQYHKTPVHKIFTRCSLSSRDLESIIDDDDKRTLIKTLKLDILKMVIANTKDIVTTYVDHEGRTLLHLAVLGTNCQKLEIIKLLLEEIEKSFENDNEEQTTNDLHNIKDNKEQMANYIRNKKDNKGETANDICNNKYGKDIQTLTLEDIEPIETLETNAANLLTDLETDTQAISAPATLSTTTSIQNNSPPMASSSAAMNILNNLISFREPQRQPQQLCNFPLTDFFSQSISFNSDIAHLMSHNQEQDNKSDSDDPIAWMSDDQEEDNTSDSDPEWTSRSSKRK